MELMCADVSRAVSCHTPYRLISLATSWHSPPRNGLSLSPSAWPKHRVLEMQYRKPIEFAGLQLTALPAGTVGSAMLLANCGQRSLLIRRLQAGWHLQQLKQPSCPTRYSRNGMHVWPPTIALPPRDESSHACSKLCSAAWPTDLPLVVHAYPLGKSQEVTKLLTSKRSAGLQNTGGLRRQPHLRRVRVSWVTSACMRSALKRARSRHATKIAREFDCRGWAKRSSIAVNGWAKDQSHKFRLGVDNRTAAFGSRRLRSTPRDCAARRTSPKVFCTHGPPNRRSSARSGFNAYPLHPPAHAGCFANRTWGRHSCLIASIGRQECLPHGCRTHGFLRTSGKFYRL